MCTVGKFEDCIRRFQFEHRPNEFQLQAKRQHITYDTFKYIMVKQGIRCEHELPYLDQSCPEMDSTLTPTQKSLLIQWKTQVMNKEGKKRDFRIIVTGETSDGKSTLINKLLGRDMCKVVGKTSNRRGVTKDVNAYEVRAPWVSPAFRLFLYDVPGWGDADIKPPMVLELLKHEQEKSGGLLMEC